MGSEGWLLVLEFYFFCEVLERERGALMGRVLKVTVGYVMEQ